MAILTVYTKLLDKTLEGARIIDMGSTKTCQCYVLPYDSVAKVGKEYLAGKYAFYILLGNRSVGGPCAYVGQTNDFTNRVSDHKQKKIGGTLHLCLSQRLMRFLQAKRYIWNI